MVVPIKNNRNLFEKNENTKQIRCRDSNCFTCSGFVNRFVIIYMLLCKYMFRIF